MLRNDMSTIDDAAASRPDDENPEWTRDDLMTARPALAVIEGVFGADAAKMVRRRPGRPRKPDRKVNQTFRLDAEVIDADRREGEGWQTRMNEVLRVHMPGRGK